MKRSRLPPALVLLLFAGAGFVSFHMELLWFAPYPQQLIRLVHDSELAEQTMCVPPHVSMVAIEKIPPRVVRAMLRRFRVQAARYYTAGRALAGTRHVMPWNWYCRAAVVGSQSRDIGGGVGPVTCSEMSIDGDSATATCELNEWLKSLIESGGAATVIDPSGSVVVTDTFVRTAAGWRISHREESFCCP